MLSIDIYLILFPLEEKIKKHGILGRYYIYWIRDRIKWFFRSSLILVIFYY